MTGHRLLAKSYDRAHYTSGPPDYALLTQHSRDVAAACRTLVEVAGAAALEAAGLPAELIARFTTTLVLSGWAQDVGKANSDFQAMVSTDPGIRQLLRHEAISGMLFWGDPQLRAWLTPVRDVLTPAVWGAVGHHRKFDADVAPTEGSRITVHVAHEDFATVLREMAADLNLPSPPHFARDITVGSSRADRGADRFASVLLAEMIDDFESEEEVFRDPNELRLVALVKGFGLAADIAASAIARRGRTASQYSVSAFIREQMKGVLQTDDLVGLIRRWAWDHHDDLTAPRDEARFPAGFAFQPFQEEVAASTSYLTLAEAGCGSGKSLAAYRWAQTWCERRSQTHQAGYRLFFCLPTTGTTTEHYKDYALESGVPADLAHSRASVDLITMAETADQEDYDVTEDTGVGPTSAGRAAQSALAAQRSKIEALGLWGTPLVVGTADAVLGLMANARRGICTLPAIVQSAIVFDEIHAFDEQLFGHLLVFLKNFPRLPVLLMTASLPEPRRRALFAVRPDLSVVPGPRDLERLERYRLVDGADTPAVDRELRDCIARNGKVLWVRNRVDWANASYLKTKKAFPSADVDIYHSRFRYADRSRRHRRVIDRFKRRGRAAVLVATQIAEMSLDLSADLLITDEAPTPALIQRLGRLNRRSSPTNPEPPKPALVTPVLEGEELPYSSADLDASRVWRALLAKLDRPLHQRDLADCFASLGPGSEFAIRDAEKNAYFFGVPHVSGLWRTRPGSTRGEGHTISVLLARDVASLGLAKSHEPDRDWLRRHEVSIPLKGAVLRWARVGGVPVAPEAAVAYDYDDTTEEGTGARWRES
jgi:CRISPR-associated endonuclease/helicase Cas3